MILHDLKALSIAIGLPLLAYGGSIYGGGGGKVPDPLVPGDGTQNITGGLQLSGNLAFSAANAIIERSSDGLDLLLINTTTGTATFPFTTAFSSRIVNERQTVTGTDDGAGTARAVTYTPTAPYGEFDCLDANGCTVTFSETGAVEGQIIYIKVLASSTGTVTIADSAGVQMVAGASIALGDDDHVEFLYDGSQWDQHTAVLAIE